MRGRASFPALAQENAILLAGNDFFSRAIGQTRGEQSLGTFDKGAKRARTGSFPRDNCPELFQSGVGAGGGRS